MMLILIGLIIFTVIVIMVMLTVLFEFYKIRKRIDDYEGRILYFRKEFSERIMYLEQRADFLESRNDSVATSKLSSEDSPAFMTSCCCHTREEIERSKNNE